MTASAAPSPARPADRPVALAPASDRTVALPVGLELRGPHADAVAAWVEGTLGWQAVDPEADALVPPRLILRDLATASEPGVPRSAPASVPVVLMVDDAASPAHVGEVTRRLGPAAVVGWPGGRDALVAVAERTLGTAPHSPQTGVTVRIGGSAGGVGTTTVALAVAGLSAWAGASTLVAVRGTGLAPRPIPTAALAAAGVRTRADDVPGVPGCRAVRLLDAGAAPAPEDPTIDLLVVDAGVDADVDVLVCRPDAAARAMIPLTSAGVVVVVGQGSIPIAALRRAADGRRGILLPASARVARAGAAGRVPAGLPGSFLRRLRPLVPGGLIPPTRTRADNPSSS